MEEFAAENDELSRTIQILNVPEDLQDEVELHVEHKKYGGGECEKFEYNRERRTLTATFVDAKG